jgi:hypothetical protein
VHIVVYIFAGLFILLALGLLFAYYRSRQPGMLLMATAYGAAAAAALVYTSWWPLILGFVLVWLFRLMGLEPNSNRAPPQ